MTDVYQERISKEMNSAWATLAIRRTCESAMPDPLHLFNNTLAQTLIKMRSHWA